ncbi:Flp pilus assembly protein CpaB [Nocardioides sp. URHA0032]|jgi:pilus assembly protein CpaB|uniref:Flp pilus assembly protein CpaB n=1 Tax=Nocardioides sp. URHA0032 TaxID=1380388 RepID=UPI0004908A5A|nr:Flp pilus assembly protein CpaB [Nocardioides sp. URHA0032]
MDRRRLLILGAAVVAVLGVALVLTYARSADARAEDRFGGVDVLVATQQLAPGETIEAAEAAGKIGTAKVARGDVLDGAGATADALKGEVALVPIYPGEQLIAAKFGSSAEAAATLPIPPGKMAVSVNLTDAARVSGFLEPGSEVSVFLNGTDPQTGQTFTRLLLPRVTVLGVGSTAPVTTTTTGDDGAPTTEELPRTLLTVAVDQKDAQKVLYASSNGELAFALINGDSKVKGGGGGVTSTNLFK